MEAPSKSLGWLTKVRNLRSLYTKVVRSRLLSIMVPTPMPVAAISPPAELHVEFPITPPTTESDPQSEQILFVASHVLSTEATALSHLSRLYATEPVARTGFVKAVEGIKLSLEQGGKTVVIGVGKSGKIGQKFVSTMNSLGLQSVFLHPVEAVHGDLGILRSVCFMLLPGKICRPLISVAWGRMT